MRTGAMVLAIGVVLGATASAPAQVVVDGSGSVASGGMISREAFSAVYGAPGNYGMAYGTPSFGAPRAWSAFSSPYGAGYGYGYAPYAYLPGPYGAGLWRPGFAAPGYLYGAGFYRTFPVPYAPTLAVPTPPVGAYAPAFGPGGY